MSRRYRYTFDFVDTQEQAQALCDRINAGYTRYMRKNHPAHYTSWESENGQEHKFVVWYYT